VTFRGGARPLGVALALAASLVAAVVRADPQTTAAAPVITLAATPIFGADATSGTGWSDIVARIDNVSAAPQKGTLELFSAAAYGAGEKFGARAPFNVPAGKSAVVRLPIHGSTYYAPAVSITALDEKGQKLATASVSVNGQPAPLLVDVDQPSRLSVVMRAWPMTPGWSPTGSPTYAYGGTGTTPLSFGVPTYDRTTGDPILPEHAAGYAAVTAVLVHTDVLARLEPASLDALVNWVLAGGTVALIPSRPEDLRGPVVTALIGGPASVGDAPTHLLRLPGVTRPPSSPGMTPFDLEEDDQAPPPAKHPPPVVPMLLSPGASAGAALVPVRGPTGRIGPAGNVKDRLTGYAGGNLHPSDLGASAAYGLGEVHLLAFDPTVTPGLDDPWVHARILEMVSRAWDRRALVAFPHGTGDRNDYRLEDVRRALDPNENFRPGLGISALLLVLYSIFAGPVTFLRAAKKGRPLRPLVIVPILSAATFGAIVLVGLASKGWRGRARHVSLVETGAGVTRGAVRRYRGFFASETKSLSVLATDRSCVLDVATGDSRSHENAILRVDRDGAALENLTSLPWQTVVVREDGFSDWKGAVSVVKNADGSIDVTNRTGNKLIDVLVWTPGIDVRWFASLEEGAHVRSTAGRFALSSSSRRHATSGTRTVHPLQAHDLGYAVTMKYNDRLAQAWTPFENAAGEAVDWWPDDVPVVVAEMVGSEKARQDSGLGLESDRVLVRVVGYGGTP
jgi:hypothetical protein